MKSLQNQTIRKVTYVFLAYASLLSSSDLNARVNIPQRSFTEESDLLINCPRISLKAVADTDEQAQDITASNRTFPSKYDFIGVALFSGNDPFSHLIKVATESKFSHVGIILADLDDKGRLYCFEATGSVGEVLHFQYPHTRLTVFNQVVEDYNGKISFRYAIINDAEEVDRQVVTEFVKTYDHMSYTKNPLKLLKALFKLNKDPKKSVLKTVFCSELLAKMLMDTGVLPLGAPANYVPKDFSARGHVNFKKGITLSREYVLKD